MFWLFGSLFFIFIEDCLKILICFVRLDCWVCVKSCWRLFKLFFFSRDCCIIWVNSCFGVMYFFKIFNGIFLLSKNFKFLSWFCLILRESCFKNVWKWLIIKLGLVFLFIMIGELLWVMSVKFLLIWMVWILVLFSF